MEKKYSLKAVLALLITLLALSYATSQEEVRCAGYKADNTRCRMFVMLPDKYCKFHNPDNVCGHIKSDGNPCRITKLPCKYHSSPTCGFIKSDGEPCKMIVEKGKKCRYHEN